jgi:glycosyltransferase involved in cell wall biosynthesis
VRIWIFNHYASPPDRPAGTRHYEFGRVLAAQGHDITIFASSFCHFSRQEERLKPGERIRVEIIDGVRFVWVRTTPYSGNDHRRAMNMLSYALGVLRAQRLFARPDVIVGSNVHLAAVLAAWLIGRLRRVPFVFEVRDLWPRTLIDMGALAEGGVAARALTGLERFLYRRARKIITLLPRAAQYIEQHGIPAGKVAYIPNGIANYDGGDAGRTGPAGPGAGAVTSWIRQRREAGCLIAGYVGSHGRANGIGLLVDAARDLRERGAQQTAFVFIGDGPDKERCERLARDYGLPDVAFWPPVPKHDVPAILKTFDVTLFCVQQVAVLYGLSSNKLFDYLASGRPVVAAGVMSDNPVSASGGGICVAPDSPAAVGDALLALGTLGEAGRRAMGERGAEWVYRHHGTTGLAERFLTVLAQARQ